MLSACSLNSAVNVDDPDAGQVLDPGQVATRSTGIGLYQQAVGMLRAGVSFKSEEVALFTDELTNATSFQTRYWEDGDARFARYRSDGIKGLDHKFLNTGSYSSLHSARVTANQARSIFRRLNDSSLNALIAGTYALEGYTIMMLAEDHCSGVPLTEVPFEGDIVYKEGISTQQLFTVAVAKFDSALAIAHDSASVLALARIGLGRAYLGLGEYTKAVQAVTDVNPSDGFYVDFRESTGPFVFWMGSNNTVAPVNSQVEIVNHEGVNGMTWFSDPAHVDPRVPVTTTTVNGVPTFPAAVQQQKYVGINIHFPLARGIEALLIRAEAALNQGNAAWVNPLNDARATVGLSALTDPVAHAARVNMLFQERAFWFYLEGVRLADYRRLVRQYDRTPESVYPVGAYTRSTGQIPFYGEAWVFLTPASEDQYNFRYHGCFNTRP